MICTLVQKHLDDLSEIYLGYENKYRVIPHPNTYQQEELEVTSVDKMNRLLYVGLLVPNKRVDRLIHAWNTLSINHPD